MPVKKKEVKEEYVSVEDFDKLIIIVEEMQANLNYINDKVARIIDRMGLNI